MKSRQFLYILFVVIAASPVCAGAQTIDAQKAAAQEALHAGDIDSAVSAYSRLAAENPMDSDILRRLASAQAASGDLSEAERTIDRALAIAPTDMDVQLARGNILFWSGKVSDAEQQASRISNASPDYPGLSHLLDSLEKNRAQNRVRLSAASVSHSLSRASFAGGIKQDWATSVAAIDLAAGPLTNVTLEADREERFAIDTRISGRIGRRIANGSVYLTGSVTPNADFRESWRVSAGIDRRVAPRTDVLLDTRYASYRGSDVGVIQAGVRQRLGREFILTGRSIHLFGGGEDYRIGGSVRFDYAPEGRTGLFVTAASYPDAEVSGTRQLRSVAAGIIAPISQNMTLRATGEYEKRENSYTRRAVTFGLGWRFGQPG